MCTIFSYHVIINNSAINIFIHYPWYTGICFSLGYMPQRATAVLWGYAHFSFIRYHQIILTRGVKNFCFPTILIWQHLISSLLNFCPMSEHLFTCLLVIWFSLLWFACSYLLIFIGRFATILSQYVFFAANLCTSWELAGTSFIAMCLQCPTQCPAYKGF